MSKVYVVECSSGDWDESHSWVHMVSLNKEIAENEAERLNKFWEQQRNIPCPCELDEYGYPIDELSMSEIDKDKFYDWWHINNEAKNMRLAIAKEYELDIIINKN